MTNKADCPTCGSHMVDVWDGKYAPHGGGHTPNKVPYPCPMTGQPVSPRTSATAVPDA